jgi:hypothetical protein
MDRHSVDALIAHETAALRSAFPLIDACCAGIEILNEGLAARFSVGLDIRLPESQVLVSGEAKHDAFAAVFAAFEHARQRLTEPA